MELNVTPPAATAETYLASTPLWSTEDLELSPPTYTFVGSGLREVGQVLSPSHTLGQASAGKVAEVINVYNRDVEVR